MPYEYSVERPKLLTEEGQRTFLAVRDRARYLLGVAGAFRNQEVISGAGGGDSWFLLACVDRLVELREIVELPRECWAQYKVYTSPETH